MGGDTTFVTDLHTMAREAGLEESGLLSLTSQLRIDKAWPEPMGPAARHGVFGELLSILEPHTESDPHALLVQALVAFGNAAGRGAYYQVEGDRHYSNEYTAIVGITSKGRKGTSWGHIRSLFVSTEGNGAASWSEQSVVGGLSTGEGLITLVRDEKKRWVEPDPKHGSPGEWVVSDPGTTDKRLLVVEPELARVFQVMQRQGNNLSPIVRDAWDRGSMQTLVSGNPLRATGAHISIIGHVTDDEIVRYLTATEAGNGFANLT